MIKSYHSSTHLFSTKVIYGKIFSLVLISLFSLSCSSGDASDDDGFIGTVVDLEFTIQNSGVVNHFLGDLGQLGSANILIQAEHYSISQIEGSQYTYEPEDGYIGTDYVELHSSIGNFTSTGNNTAKNTKTRITITITE